MDPSDFRTLLHLALDSDSINIGGAIYTQKQGVAMGNNFSPIAAIIYMDFIEGQILENTRTRVWFRYVDDIFFMTRDSYETLLSVANSINPLIQCPVYPTPSRPYIGFALSTRPFRDPA